MSIKAIETTYAGHRFRSRLEARWAVFFDALGIEWEYEPQGYEVGCTEMTMYLPDFRLPALDLWVEVKGDDTMIKWETLGRAVDTVGQTLPRSSDWKRYGQDGFGDGGPALLVLGNIPPAGSRWAHPLVRNSKGATVILSEWQDSTYFLGDRRIQLSPLVRINCWFDSSNGQDWQWEGQPPLSVHGDRLCDFRPDSQNRCHFDVDPWPRVDRAYTAARTARFEHGESGAPGA